MSKSRRNYARLVALAFGLALASSAFGQGFSVTITFDENGHGTFTNTNTNNFFSNLNFAQMADPGPGGLSSVLFYGILNPPGLTGGDVIFLEPGGLGAVSDLLRFDATAGGGALGTGGIFVYSDLADGVDSLADVGFPTSVNTNNLTFVEVGPEGNNGFTYTPTAGQPGFVTGAGGPVTYVFLSDGSLVPEPSSMALMLGGAGLIGLWRIRRRQS